MTTKAIRKKRIREKNLRPTKSGGYEVNIVIQGNLISEVYYDLKTARARKEILQTCQKYSTPIPPRPTDPTSIEVVSAYTQTSDSRANNVPQEAVVFHNFENEPARTHSVKQLIEAYEKYYIKKYGVGGKNGSDNTLRYCLAWKHYVGSICVERLFTDLSERDKFIERVKKFQELEFASSHEKKKKKKVKRNGKLQPIKKMSTFNRYRAVLSLAFTHASRHKTDDEDNLGVKWLQIVPYNIVRNLISFKNEGDDRDTKFALSPAVVKKFLATAKKHDERLYTFFLLSALTGRRKSELLSITKQDINFSKGYIKISKTKTKSRMKDTFIPISGSGKLVTELRSNLYDLCSNWHSDLLFCSPRIETKKWEYRKTMITIIKEADLQNFTQHYFRTSVTSWLRLEREFPDYWIESYLGHASKTVQEEYYWKKSLKSLKQMMSYLEDMIIKGEEIDFDM